MAEQSCQFMLWQQAVAAGKMAAAQTLAKESVNELRRLDKDFNAYWPLRNKASAKHCSRFLNWRIEEMQADLNRS